VALLENTIILSLSFKTMLAARASTRNASRIARSFATVVDTAGVKVAALDYGQPTSAVTFLVKAGSRFESKPGVAHALKNFAFKVRKSPVLCSICSMTF
jgi:hypothetical protein